MRTKNTPPEDCPVTFDCKPAKYPNTGLDTFCRELAAALAAEALRNGKKIGLYTPRGFGKIPEGAIGRPIRIGDPVRYLFDRDTKVWHCSNQLRRFIPRCPGLRVVTTVHDLNFLHEDLSPEKRKRMEERVKCNLERSDFIVTISDFTRRELQQHFGLCGTPVHTIYNGCNRPAGRPMQPADAPQHPFLFTVGTVLPKKNFHVLPCLLEGNDWELLIAGNPSDYGQQIIQEARRWGVEQRVKLLGAVPEAEKQWYLSHCKAFLFPSIAEGFGLPVVEAMQYGKPVFLSRHTCLPEIGGKHAFYFNADFDRRLMQREFRDGLRAYDEGRIDREAIVRHAQSFSWENAARAYWDIYREALNTPVLQRRVAHIEVRAKRHAANDARPFRLWKLLLCPPAAFLREFMLRGGILQGKDGLTRAVLASYKEFCLHKSRYARQHPDRFHPSQD